jgi:hypothetical protein
MPVCIIKIENGIIVNRAAVRNFFNNHDDGNWTLRSSKGNKRSNNQNSMYWGYIIHQVKDGLKEVGYDGIENDDDVHSMLKMMFLKKTVVNHDTGEMITEIPGSTTGLTTHEFSEYIEKIIKFCAEYLGFALRMPEKDSF